MVFNNYVWIWLCMCLDMHMWVWCVIIRNRLFWDKLKLTVRVCFRGDRSWQNRFFFNSLCFIFDIFCFFYRLQIINILFWMIFNYFIHMIYFPVFWILPFSSEIKKRIMWRTKSVTNISRKWNRNIVTSMAGSSEALGLRHSHKPET